MGKKSALVVCLGYNDDSDNFRGPVIDVIRVKDILIKYYDSVLNDIILMVDANDTMNTSQLHQIHIKERKNIITDEYICEKLFRL